MPNQYTGPVSVIDRFWAKVTKESFERATGLGPCWASSAAPTQQGYGRIRLTRHGRIVSTHRFSWELHYGSIPNGLCVLHKCDNPPCVRPDHLFLGTIYDNNADMVRKGRHNSSIGMRAAQATIRTHPELRARGERNAKASLTTTQVKQIRGRYVRGQTRQVDLAREYGVNQTTISLIIQRRTWAHID